MNNEYIIVNKSAIQKIDELVKEANAGKTISSINSQMAESLIRFKEQLLSQSVPLIPEIEKDFKAEPTMITDWLNEYGDPEIYKKVERELELREAAAIGKFAEKKYLERLNNFQSIDFKDGVFEGAKWQQERMYSEEEVKELLTKYLHYLTIDSDIDADTWFEQFKKK